MGVGLRWSSSLPYLIHWLGLSYLSFNADYAFHEASPTFYLKLNQEELTDRTSTYLREFETITSWLSRINPEVPERA